MPSLRSSIATPEGKRRYVRRLFATIAARYDLITVLLSYGQDARWKRRVIRLAEPGPHDALLDLACGTGDLAFEAVPYARLVVGLDVTLPILALASRRRTIEGAVRLVAGDMLALPFAASRFDVVTTGYGLRNVPDLAQAIEEIHRVLVPGGRLLSLDFNRPENRFVRAVYHAYLTVVGAALGLVLHGDPDTYRYIPESIRTYPGAAGVTRLMAERGFEVRTEAVLAGLLTIHIARKTVRESAWSG